MVELYLCWCAVAVFGTAAAVVVVMAFGEMLEALH